MKRPFFLFFIFLFVVINTLAQKITVSGIVKDSINQIELEYATIIFQNSSDSAIIGDVTNSKGVFKLQVAPGRYNATIEHLSYKPKHIQINIANEDVDLGVLNLSHTSEALNEVTVNGTVGATDIKLDKKTYNVTKDILSGGGSATDVLTNIPSVNISPEGVPIIRGSKAKIIINGRISSSTKVESIQNIPASSIQKIEVITTPSAKYSGDSQGGIINIILKKGLDNGFNGSITGSSALGDSEIHGVAASLNYRKDKLNIYTNTNYFHRKPVSSTTINNEYFVNDVADGFLNEDRTFTRKNVVFESSLGFDYYFNDYISLNIEGTYSKYNGDFTNKNTLDYFDAANNLTLTNERYQRTDHNNDIYGVSAVYIQYFEREGEIIYIDFSHKSDFEQNESELANLDLYPDFMLNPDENELIFDDIDVVNTSWFLAYDWPMNETAILGFGYETHLGNVKQDFINEVLVNGEFEPNPETTNSFDYTENWHGFYAQFDKNYDNWSFGIGLRTELTNLDSHLITTNERTKTDYTDLFPNVNVDFTLTDTKSLGISYRRGIQRVNYPRLNPFEQRISETTTYKGNPELLPFYSNSVELTLLNENEENKFTINPTLYFRNYDDIWQHVTYETGEIVNDVPKLTTTPVNLGYLNFTGIEFVSIYNATDWLEFTGTFDLRYVKQDGIFEYTNSENELVTFDFENTNISGYVNLNTVARFKNDFNVQAFVEYQLESEAAYSKREAYAFMNASASKDVFNKRATITFIASDIFNSKKIDRTRWTDDSTSHINHQWTQPSYVLSFTWRFNQSKRNKKLKFDQNDEELGY